MSEEQRNEETEVEAHGIHAGGKVSDDPRDRRRATRPAVRIEARDSATSDEADGEADAHVQGQPAEAQLESRDNNHPLGPGTRRALLRFQGGSRREPSLTSASASSTSSAFDEEDESPFVGCCGSRRHSAHSYSGHATGSSGLTGSARRLPWP